MKSISAFIIIALISAFINLSSVAASDSIEEEDIPALKIDRSKEVPTYEIVPLPTPPPELNLAQNDNRSWKKSAHKGLIFAAAEKYNLDPQIIYATIMTESEGNKDAFRYEPHIQDASLCMGQILISTARSMGFTGDPKDLYKPDICIDLIGKYYRYLVDTHGELTTKQLATAYNAGSPFKRAVKGHVKRFESWYYESSETAETKTPKS